MDYGTPNTLLGRLPNMRFLSGIKKSQRKIAVFRCVDLETINTPTRLDFTVLYLCTSKIFIYIICIYIYKIYILYYILYTTLLYYGRYKKKEGF